MTTENVYDICSAISNRDVVAGEATYHGICRQNVYDLCSAFNDWNDLASEATYHGICRQNNCIKLKVNGVKMWGSRTGKTAWPRCCSIAATMRMTSRCHLPISSFNKKARLRNPSFISSQTGAGVFRLGTAAALLLGFIGICTTSRHLTSSSGHTVSCLPVLRHAMMPNCV